MKISLDNFHWYAAFHDEGHHPVSYTHLDVYKRQLRHLGEKDGITLRIYTRQVTPAEEKRIIQNLSLIHILRAL